MDASHGHGQTDERCADEEQGTRLGNRSSRKRLDVSRGCLDRNARNGTHCECGSDSGGGLQLGEARTKNEASNETVGDEVHGRPQEMRIQGVGGSEPRERDECSQTTPLRFFHKAAGSNFLVSSSVASAPRQTVGTVHGIMDA